MCPADTIKTRIQFQGKLGSVKRYNGFLDAFIRIYKEEGVLAFAKGLPARLLYAAPAAGVSFFLYELVAGNIRAKLQGQNVSLRFSPRISINLIHKLLMPR